MKKSRIRKRLGIRLKSASSRLQAPFPPLAERKGVKLIVVDLYGVMSLGSFKETTRWLANKYHRPFDEIYKILYHKYFNGAAMGQYSEKQFFEGAMKELGFKETWRDMRRVHFSFQKSNKPVLRTVKALQDKGYVILLLSKNIPPHFNYTIRTQHLARYFKHIVNTYDLGLPKASPGTVDWILRIFKVKPDEVIFTDDQDFNLVEPKKAGMSVVLYKSFKQWERELKKLIEKSACPNAA